ncbi:hypothetical protein K0B03_00225 [Patescibacteria group bacterium]|nr:hypothetical protein [Patescibacteria group bacterium]
MVKISTAAISIEVLTFEKKSLNGVAQLVAITPDGRLVIPNKKINVKGGYGIIPDKVGSFFCNTSIIGEKPLFTIQKGGYKISVFTVNVLAKR